MPTPKPSLKIAPFEKPVSVPILPTPGLKLVEVTELIRAGKAREHFSVSGKGGTVAVIDSGLRATHVDFAQRVKALVDCTAANQPKEGSAPDGYGHGTNVAGIICAGGNHTGMAPAAEIVALKVFKNNGNGSFTYVARALDWVLTHRTELNISVVCMSLGDSQNYGDDGNLLIDKHLAIAEKISKLRAANVAVVVAAGNFYFNHGSKQGMGFPAIVRHSLSVGAVYDSPIGKMTYQNGAIAFVTETDCLTPFSQRLHESVNPVIFTHIFAPGAIVRSTGIANDHDESEQQGTSQAAPVIAGVVLLMQELHLRLTGQLPTVDQLIHWLRASAVPIQDGDNEQDNVTHTGLTFLRVDALAALETLQREVKGG